MAGERELDVSVVLPTYNESASLPVLVPRIVHALEAAGLRGEVLVVDDDSPDRTADVASALAASHPVRVLRRTQERGLATAVIAGFRMSRASVCVVMDADGSHPVEALGEMVRTILADKAEIVVGSRHVAGGGSKDWPLFSQLKSRFAASLALGLTTMTDPTTGFMAIRRSVFEKLTLDPVGWKIVLEVVVKAHPARLAEVPIVFTDRQLGESKQSARVLGQYLRHLYKLYQFRFPALVELLKFCLVGFFGLFVDLSVVAAIKRAFLMDTRLCQVFGFSAAVTFNYAINRRYSFEHARETPLIASYVTYVGTNLIGLTLRMLAIHALMAMTALDEGRGYLLLSVIGIGLATLVNFVGAKYIAFAPKRAKPDVVDSLSPPLSPRPSAVSAWVAVALGAGLLWTANLWNPAPPTVDEAVNRTMAENILGDYQGVIHPAITPGIPQNWQRDALPDLGNTPVFPLLLAGFARLGEHGMALLPGCVLAIFLAACWSALRPLERPAASAAVLLAASAPWVTKQFALLEFEPLVAACAGVGFALLVRSEGRFRLWFALLSGLATGFGFAVKMWLVLPGFLACLAYLVARSYEGGPLERTRWVRAAALYALGLVLASCSHLAFVAFSAPSDLQSWIDSVYLGIFSGRGASGAKLSGGGVISPASHWAYVQWLLRDHGALLVLFCLGLPALTRRMGVARRAFTAAVVGALLALVPLSIPVAKEPLYMAPLLPFLYALAGLALLAPDRLPAQYRRVNRVAARAALFVAGALVIGWVLFTWFLQRSFLWGPALHVAHVCVWSIPSLRVLARKTVAPCLVPCALASFVLAAALTLSGSRDLQP